MKAQRKKAVYGIPKEMKLIEKEYDRHMKIINYLEKEKDIYRARNIFFMFGLLLSVANVVGW